ncbi:hypothetical protein Q5H92_22835 [Hymenobacter sp. M29]|uniref:Uncharacterized protein n=1 Tax=Hymenobacter mellowenesis TaxID=3063995 RepID=A0ABT9AH64_9BACT|nr:hypothetical protein [Hymenobacter sp. M29]MDO7849218.1 hypothetical protein [Hymenobacter sp. M29]
MLTPAPAAAGQLRNLDPLLVDNTGGVEALWYCDVADVLSYPRTAAAALATDVVLVPGASWYQLIATRGTLSYGQAGATDRHGDFFKPLLKGALAKATPTVAAGLEALDGRRFLVLYRDQNGYVWLVGTPDSPLTWSEKYESGSPTTRNGYDFQFAGEGPRRARPYLGTWTVSGVGLETGVQLGAGTGGRVEIRDAHGNLMATVAAGRTVVVRSGFRVAFTIN